MLQRHLRQPTLTLAKSCLLSLMMLSIASADPCGMVPPIYTGPGVPITRVGDQQTYVFYKDGIESFVIHPGFQGKVQEFGMLIPFPSPPALRKVSDNIFPHIGAAVDPPEVVIYPGPIYAMDTLAAAPAAREASAVRGLAKNELRVLNEEAVGMYEVAVLEAGSAAALKKWMEEHNYRFPDGMEKVCNEYVADKWCFVAVKTKVGEKRSVDPQPGQRRINPKMPAGSTFDGRVQAMGFRFKSDELVVPMRLSAFNEGELRNIVYLLTDGPRSIRNIPEEYVVRQISGEQLVKNLTDPLPLRIVGGTEKDLQPWHYQSLPQQRDPGPRNGIAKELFASDILAVRSGKMSLRHEETEKELLRIGERLGLRGNEIDVLNRSVVKEELKKTTAEALDYLSQMTLTVVDGDFPRDVLASQNLRFAEYSMPTVKNTPKNYNAVQKGPDPNRPQGKLIYGPLEMPAEIKKQLEKQNEGRTPTGWIIPKSILFGGIGLGLFVLVRKPRFSLISCLLVSLISLSSTPETFAAGDTSDMINKLSSEGTHDKLVTQIVTAATDANERDAVVKKLIRLAQDGSAKIPARGWAIVALGEIGGMDVDEALLKIQRDPGVRAIPKQDTVRPEAPLRRRMIRQPTPQEGDPATLIKTWAAAARVSMSRSAEALLEKAPWIHQFPALARPISQRLVAEFSKSGDVSVEQMLKASMEVYQIAGALAPAILAQGADELIRAMTEAEDQTVRRQAAAYLASLGAEDSQSVATAVIEKYRFDVAASQVPWDGGPLFIPSIDWEQDAGRELLRHLVAWNIWADRQDDMNLQRQLHNNLRSLAGRLGVASPNNQFASPREWLLAWGKVAGKQQVEELLNEQGLSQSATYRRVLRKL